MVSGFAVIVATKYPVPFPVPGANDNQVIFEDTVHGAVGLPPAMVIRTVSFAALLAAFHIAGIVVIVVTARPDCVTIIVSRNGVVPVPTTIRFVVREVCAKFAAVVAINVPLPLPLPGATLNHAGASEINVQCALGTSPLIVTEMVSCDDADEAFHEWVDSVNCVTTARPAWVTNTVRVFG